MVEENIGLAHLCARRFLGRGMEYDDLFQAGCVGLLKAVENFDTSRGVKFSTYAVPVILGEIRRLFRDGGALRVSRGLRDLSRKALEEADKLRQETRRYAKRQLTWFRREQDVRWIARDHVPDRLLVQEAARIVAKELEISYTIE